MSRELLRHTYSQEFEYKPELEECLYVYVDNSKGINSPIYFLTKINELYYWIKLFDLMNENIIYYHELETALDAIVKISVDNPIKVYKLNNYLELVRFINDRHNSVL